jgi:D-alanine transaminase
MSASAEEPRVPRVWLNGQLVEESRATVSVYDRGFLFGDGIYELVRFVRTAEGHAAGRRYGIGLDLHVERLRRSLRLARISGFSADDLPSICDRVLDANGLDDAAVYLQITRGAGPSRSHVPQGPLKPTIFAAATACEPLERMREPSVVRAITLEDLRWRLCQIKTISLMGNILALLEADGHGGTEAILHRDGLVSEGAYTNVMVVRGMTLATPPVDDDPPILHGVTRADALRLAAHAGLRAEVRPIALGELADADEILITSSRRLISAVGSLDGRAVGDGTAGPAARALFQAMRDDTLRAAGFRAPLSLERA